MDKATESRGPVHLGGFVERLGDRLQPRQDTEENKGEELPDAHDNRGEHDMVGAQPTDRVADNAQGQQPVVHDAVHVVEQPLP